MTEREMQQIENKFSKRYDEMVKRQKIEVIKMIREQMKNGNNQASFIVIDDLINNTDLHGYVVSNIYAKYCDLCELNGVHDVLDKIAFSKFIIRWYDYHIVNKKYKGKKLRVFCKNEDTITAVQDSSRLGKVEVNSELDQSIGIT